MKNNPIAIAVKNIDKYFGKEHILKNVSFSVSKGSIHGFIGTNGSGKTTTIKSIVDAFGNYNGEILIADLSNRTVIAKTKLGYVPERAVFPKRDTVLGYLKYMGTLNNLSLKESRKRALNLLKEYKMDWAEKKNPNDLSSGQQKKIMLIQSLISNPEILILDEPFSNLDPIVRHELFSFLKKINKKSVTIFITSHLLSELEEIINEITVISNGNIVYTGSSKNFIKKSTLKKAFLKKVGPS